MSLKAVLEEFSDCYLKKNKNKTGYQDPALQLRDKFLSTIPLLSFYSAHRHAELVFEV